jgi:hypothetical protein
MVPTKAPKDVIIHPAVDDGLELIIKRSQVSWL